MSQFLNPQQQAVVDQDNRNMANGSSGVDPMSVIINDIFATIDAGTIGITSAGADVDSLALGGGAFTWDQSTAPGNSLLFAWLAGRVYNGLTVISVAPGSLALAASTTNFVEVNRAGVVSSNTAGFTSGRCPLYVVTTGSGSFTAAQVVSAKALLTLIGNGAITGAQLTTPGSTKELSAQLGTISATTSFLITSPGIAATLLAASFTNSTAFAGSDTNYWTFSITNLGQAGAGATAMLAASALNTTKLTGGTPLVASGRGDWILNATGANLITASSDVLQITFTKTGAPANLTLASIRLDFGFTS